ncbi:MAG: transglycosylase SLT domain-containing protein [Bacteroidales bacterium]
MSALKYRFNPNLTFLLIFLLPWPTMLLASGGLLIYSSCPVTQKLDSLKEFKIFNNPTGIVHDNPVNQTYPDLVYEVKIASIDYLSPISFDFNEHVKQYIDVYTIERREQVSQMLGLAELYFPLFDEFLDKYQLPLEFKYLAVVESALNPLAVSRSGAVGLWQFKINSGRMFDLEVNSYIDERMDPMKSTEAACMYLKYLYRIFNDWHLVMAAYNAGPGVVRNAIFRAGGETNYWQLYEHLPEDAQNYVPAFIAATYVMQNAQSHNIKPTPPDVTYFQTDTVQVKKAISFSTLSNEIDVPIDIIRFLNPIYRKGHVPILEDPATIRIPDTKVEMFFKKESTIYEKSINKPDFHEILENSGSTNNRIKMIHTVQSGDYLHKIAVKYKCTVDDIMVWNPEVDSNLNVGQTLTIWVDNVTYKEIQSLNYMP